MIPADVPLDYSLLGTVPQYNRTGDFGFMEVDFDLKIALPPRIFDESETLTWKVSIHIFLRSELPLSEVPELCLRGEWLDGYQSSAGKVLESFSALRTLVLDGPYWPRLFLQRLSESLDAGCVLPELCTLKLVHTNWCRHPSIKHPWMTEEVA